MEDRVFPMLWKSGVTNMSVTLLHTTWADGKSIRKHWITGITSLEEDGRMFTSGQLMRNFAKYNK